MELTSSSARVKSIKVNQASVTKKERPRPIDRTPGTPGSGKNGLYKRRCPHIGMVIDAIVLPEVQGSAALDHQLVYVSTGQGQAQSLPKLLEREREKKDVLLIL